MTPEQQAELRAAASELDALAEQFNKALERARKAWYCPMTRDWEDIKVDPNYSAEVERAVEEREMVAKLTPKQKQTYLTRLDSDPLPCTPWDTIKKGLGVS